MDIFDTHFHVGAEDELPAMMQRAAAAGVNRMLVAGASPERMAENLQRVQATWQNGQPDPACRVYIAAGVHPHDAAKAPDDLAAYRAWTAEPCVVAIGEIGLDYHYDYSPRARQQEVFGKFLDMAMDLDLPVIVHCREAYEDTHAMLRDRLPSGRFVVHCFSGTPAWAEKFLALGGSLSYTGLITFPKGENVRESLRVTPLDRVFFETDSPYLAPTPHRGKTNEPALVPHIVERAAMEFGLSLPEMARISTRNACRFFNVA